MQPYGTSRPHENAQRYAGNNFQVSAPQMQPSDSKRKERGRRMPLILALAIDTGIALVLLLLFCANLFLIPRPLTPEGQVLPFVTQSVQYGGEPVATVTPPAQEASASLGDQGTGTPSGQEPGDWFPEKFTSGDVVKTSDGYQDGNVNIAIQKVQEDGITYFVADVYVRNVQYFRTYFANNTYGTGYRQSVSEMAEASKAIVAISGDYYGNQSRGVVIRNGSVYRKSVESDVCVLYNDGTMATYSPESFSVDQAIAKGAWQAWSFGPKLLTGGQPMTQFNTSVGVANPRSALGYYEPGHYCLVVVDGRQDGYSKGMTMTELSQMFYNLGCKEAYNLDGGQTAQMVFNGATVNQPYHGGRAVSDIVYIGE